MHNFGPSDSTGVFFTDALPDGLTFVSGASVIGAWTCASTPAPPVNAFRCDLTGSIADGGDAEVDVTVAIVAGTGPDPVTFVNSATVSATTFDPVLGNNTDGDDTGFVGRADLEIDKASGGAVIAGENLEYTLSVWNNGPSDSVGTAAEPILVEDALPSTLQFVSVTDGAWTCTHTDAVVGVSGPGGTVTCRLESTIVAPVLPATQTPADPITIVVRVLPDAGAGDLVNTAVVSAGLTTDPEPNNNSSDDTVVVSELTDMTVVKTVSPDQINAGETTSFTITANNAGPSQAESVTVTDTMPDGLLIDSVDTPPGSGWDCSHTETTLLCRLDALAPGNAPPITVGVRANSGVPGDTDLVNTATVSTATPETDELNNTGDATLTVNAEADIAVRKTHGPGPVAAGTTMEFTLTVDNLIGPSDAVAPVVVVDTLPLGFRYVTNVGPWECVPAAYDSTLNQIVSCTYDDGTGDLPLQAGGTAEDLVMTVSIDADVDPASYDNVASVSSPTFDPNITETDTNNEATDTVEVVTLADLSIVKSHDASAVRIGDPLTFTLQVSNDGPSEARDVAVGDTLPAGLTYVSVDAPDWTCVVAAQAISCLLDDPLDSHTLAPPIAVTATVEVAAYPTVSNSATVTSSTPEDPSTIVDNTSVDEVTVPAQVDLGITKSHRGPVKVGGTVTYTITVANSGPTVDPGPVTIVDTMPNGLTPKSATGDGLACDIGGSVVTCMSLRPLPVGGSFVVTVVAAVGPAAYPSVTNTATVSTTSEETSLTNNSAVDRAPVTPLVALELAKTLDGSANSSAVWALAVTNAGPNATVVPIVLTDPLPVGLMYVSAAGDGWACSASANVVTCSYAASLPAGATAPTLRITTAINAPPGSTIANTATVAGGGPETPSATSTSSVTTPTGSLPSTGSDPNGIVRIALLLLAFGFLLAAATRRRRAHSYQPPTGNR